MNSCKRQNVKIWALSSIIFIIIVGFYDQYNIYFSSLYADVFTESASELLSLIRKL